MTYTPARNAVQLYRVTYPSVVPERGNRPTVATGLLAVPDTAPATASRWSPTSTAPSTGSSRCPPFPDQSPETQLMIAQFAGQGYVVIGADYFGMGGSTEPEGYMVKASHQQATYDMLMASRAVLGRPRARDDQRSFLAGWSQGGFVTHGDAREARGRRRAGRRPRPPPARRSTSSSRSTASSTSRARTTRPGCTTLFILSSFSFENYYGVPGLARSLITDEYYDIARKAYERAAVRRRRRADRPAQAGPPASISTRSSSPTPPTAASSRKPAPIAGSSGRRCATTTARPTRRSAPASAGCR